MSDKIDLEIVTPKGRAMMAAVDEVTAPSVSGEFGVLRGHLPLVASLRTGIVSFRVGGETKRVAVGAGFAEAGPTRLLIVAQDYAEREHIDPVRVHKELAEVQVKLDAATFSASEGGDSLSDRRVLIERENWLAVQLELYGETPPATFRPNDEPNDPWDGPSSPSPGASSDVETPDA